MLFFGCSAAIISAELLATLFAPGEFEATCSYRRFGRRVCQVTD